MAEWGPFALATKSAKARSPGSSSEELTNLYLAENPEGAPQPFTLYGTPGLKRLATIDETVPTRGVARYGERIFAVVGQSLYAIDLSGLVTAIGTVEGTRPVRMTATGDANTNGKLLIAADAKYYVATDTTIAEANRGQFLSVAYQDGYGLLAERATQAFYITNIDNPIVVSPLDFTTVDAQGDVNVGGVEFAGQYWHAKKRTIEVFANTGAAAFPFQRQAVIQRGMTSIGSVAVGAEMLIFQGDDRRIYAAQGYAPRRLSTPEVELSIDAQPSVTDAEAFAYSQGGRTFYQLSLQSVTWVCDLSTGRWSQRSTRFLPRHRAHGCTYFEGPGRTFVGDYRRGVIFELDLNTYTDDGLPIERVITCPQIDAGGRRMSHAEIELQILTGTGDLDNARYAYLEWSDDDGRTWCDPQMAPFGRLGEYGLAYSARWLRLGSFESRIYRFRVFDPCFVAIRGARCRTEVWQ